MKKAIYPGSFDPVTLGHLDIIRRSASLVDHLIVGVLNNSTKTPLFSVEERVNMLREVTKDLPNVEVLSFSGLLVDFAAEHNVSVIIRGLRAVTDFEYELAMSQTNRVAAPGIDTVFLSRHLFCDGENTLCSSEIDENRFIAYPLHDSGDNLALSAGKIIIDDSSLRLADTLNHHLLCRLRRDPPEILRCDFEFKDIADLTVLIKLSCLVQREFPVFVHHIFVGHDIFSHIYVDIPVDPVDIDSHILRIAVIFLVRRYERRFDGIDEKIL